jgi:hypothetical protein
MRSDLNFFCGKNLADSQLRFRGKIELGQSWEKPWEHDLNFSHFPVFLERSFEI